MGKRKRRKNVNISYVPLSRADEIKSEVFKRNGDIDFFYKGKEYFFTYFERETPDGTSIQRCLRAGLKGPVLCWYPDDVSPEDVVIDGKNLLEIANDITDVSIY